MSLHHLPEIEIFDTNFISDNIYTGSVIDSNHRKNLLEIIFGQQGITLKSEISVLKDNLQNDNREFRNIKNRIEQAIEHAHTAEVYSTLQSDPDIDNKIQLKENEITTALSHDEIQHKNSLSELETYGPQVDYETVSEVLQKSIDSISQEYIDKFKEHTTELEMDGEAEEWVTKGYNAIKNEECPFCLRTLDDSIDIFVAYKQYFNEEYIELVTEIREINTKLQNSSMDSYYFNLERSINNNVSLIEFWNKHLQTQIDFSNLLQNKDDISEAYTEYKKLVHIKSQSPLESFPIDKMAQFKTKIVQLNQVITAINQQINDANELINELKQQSQADVAALKDELKVLKSIKKLDEQAMINDCAEYVRLKNRIETQNTEKENKQEQLNNYSNALFNTYATSINNYLRSLAPYLNIKDIESAYVGQSREPLVKYVLEIDGNDISLSENSNGHCFKYCFSEGDKSALALSFFLAKLEVDGDIANKIIVFDDPISSFDLNRKTATISQLQNICQQAEQLFILTHNIVFAAETWKELNHTTSLCIKIGFLNNSSILSLFDIRYETLSSVLKDCTLIKNYLTNGTLEEHIKRAVARAIRPALESYYHLKFFDFVAENEWLGDFIRQIREAQPTDVYYRLQANIPELTELNNYSKRYHHRFNTNADNEPINEGELRNYCQRTLDLIQVI